MTSLTDQQQRAVETIDKHVLVCAGAGSGKTHVLIERFIEILKKNEDISVSQLVAVTFTRKAATEMRNRLKAKLKGLADAGGEGAERWQKCLGEVDGARIGTIHSLCEFIIKSFPVEAGIDPQFEVIDELMQAELLGASIDQAFREVIAGAAVEQTLFEDFDLDIVRQLVTQGIQGSSRFFESLQNFPLADEAALTDHIEHHVRRARKICLQQLVKTSEWQQNIPQVRTTELPVGSKLEAYRKEFIESAQEIENMGSVHAIEGVDVVGQAWNSLWTIANQTPRTTGGTEGKPLRDLMKGVRDICKGYSEKIAPTLVPSDQDALRCIVALVSLIQRTVEIYREQKRVDLLLDFNDLISLAFSALTTQNSAALRYFNENTHTLLVDEFQDTNTVQSDLLALIAGDKAKFFLIGDDKQSIYRFQGADVSTFNKWRRRFDGSDEALTLNLSESFRSHPELVAFVNIVFASLMDDGGDEESHRALFERLQAARKDSDSGRVEIVVCQPEYEAISADPDAPRRLEAEAVADWISQKIADAVTIFDKHQGCERVATLGDFTVLVPRNSDFAYFERAMSDRSMPYVVVSGKGYLERQEILDLENLLRFLASPRDNHALVAALRSPMFAISDDLVHKIAVEGGTHSNDSLWRKMRTLDAQSGSSLSVLSRAITLLEKFLLQSKLLSLSALVRAIVVETNYDLILLSVPNGLQRSRNLWKLVAIAADKEHSSCGEFAEMLARMRDVGVKLADAPTDDANAVKLMTIHASKGLEFPFVALPVLSARNAMKKDRLLFHKDYGIAFNTARTEEDLVPTWVQACKILDEDMELAEKKRLFYVAMTRARDNIALFVQSDGGDRNTFKSWLMDALSIEPEDLDSNECTKTVRRGQDEAIVSIRQYEPAQGRQPADGALANDSEDKKPASDAGRDARQLLSRLHEVTESSQTDFSIDENAYVLDKLPQINDVQAGVAVVADECGQMKFLFAQESAVSYSNDAGEDPSVASENEARINESLSRLPARLLEPLQESPTADINQWTLDLIEPLYSEKLQLPSSWQGCERITSVGDQPVFSATLLGTFFHSLMENIPPDGRHLNETEVEAIAFAQSAVIPLPANLRALVQHGLELLDKFYASSFYNIFVSAKRRLHELPYLYNTADGVTQSRRPDLILQNMTGQWLLVDYKTDHFEQSKLLKHSHEHGEQLRTYVSELNDLLGVSLSAYIYYAQYGLLHECSQVA